MKQLKQLSLAVTLLLFISAAPGRAGIPQDLPDGDCNGDNRVTISDLQLIVQVALGRDVGCVSADFNRNGRIEVFEIVIIIAGTLAN